MTRNQGRLPLADEQAEAFGRTRSDHRNEIAEDYVELIADLIDATGEARAVDLATRLGVTNATVNNTVTRLQREGLVHSEPYRAIFLTSEGRDLAEHCRRRHRAWPAPCRAGRCAGSAPHPSHSPESSPPSDSARA